MAQYAADAPTLNGIRTLALAENINLANADEYELNTRRLYTSLPPDGTVVDRHGPGPWAGTPLQTRFVNDPNGDGNKLDSHVFFKFTVVIPGNYEIKVVPTNNKRLYIQLNDHGKKQGNKTAKLGETQTLDVPLVPGDYTLGVQSTSSVPATFSVSVTLKSLFTQ
jgi:hypothetical protein